MKIDREYSVIYIHNPIRGQVETWHTRRRRPMGAVSVFATGNYHCQLLSFLFQTFALPPLTAPPATRTKSARMEVVFAIPDITRIRPELAFKVIYHFHHLFTHAITILNKKILCTMKEDGWMIVWIMRFYYYGNMDLRNVINNWKTWDQFEPLFQNMAKIGWILPQNTFLSRSNSSQSILTTFPLTLCRQMQRRFWLPRSEQRMLAKQLCMQVWVLFEHCRYLCLR